MPKLVGLKCAAAVLLAACSGGNGGTAPAEPIETTTAVPATTTTSQPSTTVPTPPVISVEAEDYLEEALEALRSHSINRDRVYWDAVEEAASRAAAGAQTPRATHGAIGLALRMLHDDHSAFLPPTQADEFSDGPAVFVPPEVEARPDGIGFVSIGRYLGDIGEEADAYAADLATRIEAIAGGVCGWILDLRTNTGGNMWPMLAGLGPMLRQGVVGSFTYPDGEVEPWELRGSTALWDGLGMVDHGLAETADADLPVAVLISSLTASSGEAVAIAFHGQEQSRFFGQATAGLTTSNEPVELSDGATIFLTMSNFTDRLGRQYGQDLSVEPDQATSTHQEAAAAAIDWLLGTPACSTSPGAGTP
jgi:C-terminal processing protease CtpA/Prc